ncbi:hypothetical protein H107_04705 [Trichophyton rubrum CBS 202.88]|nr:hypothetical protein H104_04566 [Trichophyton rubrum CBS 289.86]EZG16539.1 hypothetical protein H107_04705 [Trichophyton rubrum CBS 202.88]
MAPRTPRKSPQTTSRHKIMVGIDYGTTFTGKEAVIVWKSSDAKDVIVIGTWPGPSRDSETVFKAPSRIAYPLDNPANSTIRWGFQVEPGMTTYSWTKLLVDRNIALGEFDDPTLEEASKTGILQLSCGKSAVGVVADFLKEVRAHVLKMIEKRITKEMLGITPIEYWFTVPAIWSDQAKAQTKAAFNAQALPTTLNGLMTKYPCLMMESWYVIAAVVQCPKKDITTYLINKVDPILSFEEPCTGIGGKCGSTAIDRNSYRLMSRRFGKAFDMLPAKKKGPGSEYMRKFEIIKKDFGFNIEEDKIYELPLNMRANKVKAEYFDDEERLVLLSSDDIRQLFDPVVDQVIGLVRKQIDDAEDAESGIIVQKILVGGFGDSEYLREKMEKSFCGIIITVPDNPLPFRQGIDSEKNAHVDEFTRKKMVGGIMKWMIFKGEKYTENHTHTVDYNQVYRSGRSMIIKSVLFSSDSNEAPERVERTSIKKVGTICVDITDIDSNLLEKRLIDGVLSYHVEFSVKVIFGAQDGVLRFETTSQGKLVGKTTIDFTNTKYY